MVHGRGFVGEHFEYLGTRLLLFVHQRLEDSGMSRVSKGPHVAIVPGSYPQTEQVGLVVALGVAHPAQSAGAIVDGYFMDGVARRSVHQLPFRCNQLAVLADVLVIRMGVAMAARLRFEFRHGSVLQSPMELDAHCRNVLLPWHGQIVVFLGAHQCLREEGQLVQFLFNSSVVDGHFEQVVLAPRCRGRVQNPRMSTAREAGPATRGRRGEQVANLRGEEVHGCKVREGQKHVKDHDGGERCQDAVGPAFIFGVFFCASFSAFLGRRWHIYGGDAWLHMCGY
mmetsp:Transcript_28616/g.82855  ORF Transcript_28616/g.82855 Transcript_28616/m.82855 type:complete len:282 (+) Transcript_28616:1468-2313(+)